jgi:putative oxygen-independent coproporphyrinogen III oxidase
MRDTILYVHVPFCSSKCHFCSWVLDIPTRDLVKSQDRYADYTRAVITQIRHHAHALREHGVRTRAIYFGGGTPTMLSETELGSMMQALRSEFPTSPEFEGATIEISPETVDESKLRALREAGFDRISMGVQSFNDARLKQLGRAHTRGTVEAAVGAARAAGFDNVNLDLMFGLPDESFDEWTATLEAGLALDPDHFSLYLFYPFGGTVIGDRVARGVCSPPDADSVTARYLWAADRLVSQGYGEYMFQLFERHGKRCVVDAGYFQLEHECLGFGAGAHSVFGRKTFGQHAGLTSYLQKPTTPDYIGPIARNPSVIATKFYEMLHTDRGLDYQRFEAKLGISFERACDTVYGVRQMHEEVQRSGRLQHSPSGFTFRDWRTRAEWFCGRDRSVVAPLAITSRDTAGHPKAS